MPVSPYIREVRERIGSGFLLVPSISVLIADDSERLLLVRSADFGLWATLGGAVDPDESPADAARREAMEEIGVTIEITGLRGCCGGPAYRVTYPNGDQVGYVSSVFDARIASGSPAPDLDEIVEIGWFTPAEMGPLDIEVLSRQLLIDVGVLR